MAKSYLDDNGLLYVWGKIKTYVTGLLTGKQDTINDLSDIRSNASMGATAVQPTRKVNGKPLSADVTLKTSDLDNDSGYITTSDIPEGAAASTTTPLMDGTAAVGTELAFARGDHRHPSDTTKANASELKIEDVSGASDKKKITLKSGTSQEVIIAHQSITGKVDKTTTVNGHALSSNVSVTKEDVGLTNVTNDAQVKRSEMGTANGVATLDGNGMVPSSQLPSYVDDVIEAYARTGQTALSAGWLATGSASGTAITPESGKIYVLMANAGDYAANTQFRWGGTAYVKMNDGGVSAITNAEIDEIIV